MWYGPKDNVSPNTTTACVMKIYWRMNLFPISATRRYAPFGEIETPEGEANWTVGVGSVVTVAFCIMIFLILLFPVSAT
jgi:hypothetical protein